MHSMTMKAFTMMKNKRLQIILYIAAAIILIILIISLRHCNRFTPPPSDTDSTTESTSDKELDFLPAGDNNGRIQIPTVTGLNMRAGQLEQTVDFYNPKENSCYFVITICLSDDTVIYKSELLAPSKHITSITLSQELQRGLYRNCRMIYNCYALDGKTQLNGSNVVLEINSQ